MKGEEEVEKKESRGDKEMMRRRGKKKGWKKEMVEVEEMGKMEEKGERGRKREER